PLPGGISWMPTGPGIPRPEPVGHAAGIRPIRRSIAHVPLQVVVAAGEADRVFAHEAARLRVVPAGAVVVQVGVCVPFAAGVGVEELYAGGGLGRQVAEAVVLAVVDDAGGAGAG